MKFLYRTVRFPVLFILICFSCALRKQNLTEPEWKSIFNGKNLEGWTPKIRGFALGENFGNTFRVEDGLMVVNYDGYDEFKQQYGHIFYKNSFSSYKIRLKYRFYEGQCKGGEGWAYKNSGIMLHCQDPETMGLDQDFPISIEAQILNADNADQTRPTMNLCTPGTQVHIDGKLFTPHCTKSNSKTYYTDKWVEVMCEVYQDSLVRHYVNGEVVMEYTKPSIGGGNVKGHDPKIKEDGKALTSGWISLQSESHPVAFKDIEIMDLSGQ